jgi:uncharacterized short protein YbdD (DUF466 family)
MKKFLLLILNYLNGNFAYQNYLKHQKKNHPNQNPLSKKNFLREMQKLKWQKINRCC